MCAAGGRALSEQWVAEHVPHTFTLGCSRDFVAQPFTAGVPTGTVGQLNARSLCADAPIGLDHAWGDTEPPATRISSRKAMPHVVTRFQRSTRIL